MQRLTTHTGSADVPSEQCAFTANRKTKMSPQGQEEAKADLLQCSNTVDDYFALVLRIRTGALPIFRALFHGEREVPNSLPSVDRALICTGRAGPTRVGSSRFTSRVSREVGVALVCPCNAQSQPLVSKTNLTWQVFIHGSQLWVGKPPSS